MRVKVEKTGSGCCKDKTSVGVEALEGVEPQGRGHRGNKKTSSVPLKEGRKEKTEHLATACAQGRFLGAKDPHSHSPLHRPLRELTHCFLASKRPPSV